MCGIFGIHGASDASTVTAAALHAQQHRGQEAFGISTSDGSRIQTARKIGLVSVSLARHDFLNALPGKMAIGHVRYSTAGKKDGTDTERTRNAQPLHTTFAFGEIAIVHNGTLTNAQTLKQDLLERGRTFQSDTPTVEELFAHDCKTDEEVMQKVCKETGADSVGFISLEGLYTACQKSYNADKPTFCDACLTGNYPMKLIDKE